MKKYVTCKETSKLIGSLSNFGPRSREELHQQLSNMPQKIVKQLTLRIKL